MSLGTILTNASAGDRPKDDFYGTPPDVTIALLRFAEWIPDVVWEPACGDGSMARVLTESGRKVIATDIAQGEDFLQSTELKASWIITNPPFKLAHKFIYTAFDLKAEGLCLLLKSQYWHAAGRLRLFKEIKPAYVLPLTWRPDFHYGKKGGSPTMEVFWTIWQYPYNPQSTAYIPLPRPR